MASIKEAATRYKGGGGANAQLDRHLEREAIKKAAKVAKAKKAKTAVIAKPKKKRSILDDVKSSFTHLF